MDSSKLLFFPYSWHIRDSEIHVYGFDQQNCPLLVRLTDFTPYVYVKLPNYIDWSPTNVSRLVQVLKKNGKIHKSSLIFKRPLYFANVSLDHTTQNLKHELHPYLFLAFENERERKNFAYNTRKKQSVMGIGNIEFEIYEHNASAVLQLTCLRNISTADWFYVKNPKPATETISRLKQEYSVNWKSVSPLPDGQTLNRLPEPLIMSWDIECSFNNPNKFSDGSQPNDIVFQISCVFGRQSQPKDKWEKYLLTLGNPDPKLLPGIKILSFKKEFQLLLGFNDLVIEKNPQLLIGYNIFKFDIPFMFKRAIAQRIQDDFVRHGCTRDKCKLETIKWSSSAYSNQEMNFIDLQGRMTIDVLTLIQRDFNLETYKLDAVAEKFLGANKDPLNHHDIFMCYELGMKESKHGVSKSMALVGKYCVKDSLLVLELFEKFQYWYSLTEMAKICQVPHSHLFLYGQQLKVFSQVYKYCYQNNIVVESGRFKTAEDDFCAGACVLTPKPGLYDNVVSFDFQSLYPSIIISHNIDFTTLVPDDSKIEDEHCRVIEWEEHINCKCPNTTVSKDKNDVRCKNYRYKWLKNIPGVLPTIIRNLLEARKKVRKQMKEIDSKSLEYDILNKRQLAYKVSSNSMYGALSTKKGYLPFLPAGMCVTAVGRQSIEKVSHVIQHEHNGHVVYGDSVLGNTPILLRNSITKEILIQPIETLVHTLDWKPYRGFKLFDSCIRYNKEYGTSHYEVWSDKGWSPIRKVIRHKTHKQIYKVRTQSGLVYVTEDHSLLNEKGQKLKPHEAKIGTPLLHAWPFPVKANYSSPESLTKDKAFIFGYSFHQTGFFPEQLLNSSEKVQRGFLDGYCSRAQSGFVIQQNNTRRINIRGLLNAQRMYYILRKLKYHVRFTEELELFTLWFSTESFHEPNHTILECTPVDFVDGNQFVYDLETECGHFQAGVGQMIVKNTDSNYVVFPHLNNLKDIWEHSVRVSDEVSKYFPEPMRLEFEENIYARYLILSKKRYLYFSTNAEGKMSNKIENKGVLLKRRDNSKVIRDIYEQMIRMVLNRYPETDLISKLLEFINMLFSCVIQPEDFSMSKSVKGIEQFNMSYRDARTIQYGDYVVPRLKENSEERASQLLEKGAQNEEQFYQSHLPGAVQLALRMRARGQHIESGSRLSYIITRRSDAKANVSEKMEEIDYFKMNYSKQMIDVFHYLHLLINPIEEVLIVMYGKKYKNFIKDIYKFRIKYNGVVDQMYRLFHPVYYENNPYASMNESVHTSKQLRITDMFNVFTTTPKSKKTTTRKPKTKE